MLKFLKISEFKSFSNQNFHEIFFFLFFLGFSGIRRFSNSGKSHPPTTYGILDFLLRLIKEFHGPLETEIQRGIINSFRYILKVGVVRSLSPILVDTQKQGMITSCLKNLIAAHLTEFLPPEMRKVEPVVAPPTVRKGKV